MERGPADEQVEERAAEGVDVGTAIGLVAVAGLLGRQVVGRAQHLLVMSPGERGVVLRHGERQPEVEDLDVPSLVDDQIGRFDVAVDEPLVVRVLQAERRLADEIGRLPHRQRAVLLDPGVQILPLDVLHHDEVDGAGRVEVEGAGDVRMVEPGGGLRLPLEPGQVGTLVDPLHRQHLDRHLVVQGGVLGEINAAHAAGTEQTQKLVLPQHETLVPSPPQLVDLPLGEKFAAEEGGDQLVGHGPGGGFPGGHQLVELCGRDQSAGPHRLEKVGGRLGGFAHARATAVQAAWGVEEGFGRAGGVKSTPVER